MDTHFSGGFVAPAVSDDFDVSCDTLSSLTAVACAQIEARPGLPTDVDRGSLAAGQQGPRLPAQGRGEEAGRLAPAHPGDFTGPRRARFLHYLAERGNVRRACARVGISPQAAYLARRRDAVFAAGWNAALVHARDWSEQVLADCATEGVREAVWHRGELVGERTKIDARLLLAHLARLDARCADSRAELHAGRFDEILALVAGETFPARMADQREGFHDWADPFLPMASERYAREGGEALQRDAEARLYEAAGGDCAAEAMDPPDEAELAAEQARDAAMWAAQGHAAAERAVWDDRVAAVGAALEADEDPVVSDGAWDEDPAQALADVLADVLAEEPAGRAGDFLPRTVSTVSTLPDEGEVDEASQDGNHAGAPHSRRAVPVGWLAGTRDRPPPGGRPAAIPGRAHNGPGSLGVRPPSAYAARNDARKVGRDAECAPGEVQEQKQMQGEEGLALGPGADAEGEPDLDPEPEPKAETEMRPASQPASLGPPFRIPTDGRCTPFP